MTSLHDYQEMVERFNMEIIGMEIPNEPKRLSHERKAFAMECLNEELDEFFDAATLEGEADALVDLAYFAFGRLVEMGLSPKLLFDEVHAANMKKKRGELSKRPNSNGYDAIKPEGWEPPDLAPFLKVDRADLIFADRIGDDDIIIAGRNEIVIDASKPYHPEPLHFNLECPPGDVPDYKPKIILLGYGRHGKDTVAEMLRDKYDMTFTSSSLFCADRVMMPAFKKEGILYEDAEECFHDRHTADNRAFWYEAIRDFNRPDASSLGRAIFEENDVYCGLRSKAELAAIKNCHIQDHIIWVDRSDTIPPEDKSSCTVEPWMADYILDNNGSLEDLAFNLDQLMENLL